MSGKKDKKEAKKPEAEAAPGAEGEAPAKKKMSGKTLVLFIILPAVLVIGGGATAAVLLMGGKSAAAAPASGDGHGAPAKKPDAHGAPAAGGDHGGGAPAAAGDPAEVGHALPCEHGNPCYYMMPKQIVNLAGGEGRAPFLEIELALESGDPGNFNAVPTLMPRLKDQFQAFLRELRVDDIQGSAGSFRLRQELLKRFNLVMAPAHVDAVLIESLLIQE